LSLEPLTAKKIILVAIKKDKKEGKQGAKTDSYFGRYNCYAAYGPREGFFGLRLVSQRKIIF
jgi:hypothetical protein